MVHSAKLLSKKAVLNFHYQYGGNYASFSVPLSQSEVIYVVR